MTPEGRVKAKIRALLVKKELGYWFMPVQSGLGGVALDYYCCFGGLFVAIEAKAKGKKLKPRQIVMAVAIAAAGGQVFVIRDDDDLAAMQRYLSDYNNRSTIYDTLGDVETYGEYWCP